MLSAQMHTNGVTMLKAKSGDFEVELHVPVPRVLSPTQRPLVAGPETQRAEDGDEADEEPEWKRQSRALDRELELG